MTAGADPRRDEFVRRIGRARRAIQVAHAVESLLVAASAALLTLAAARVDRAADSPGAWSVALLAALAACGAWWLECVRDERTVVRHIDARDGYSGALLTAWEQATGEGVPAGLRDVLVERLLPAVRGPGLWSRGLNVRVPLVASVCTATTLWALAAGLHPGGDAAPIAEALRAAAAALDRVESSADTLKGAAESNPAALAEAARAIAAAARDRGEIDPRTAQTARELLQTAGEIASDPRRTEAERTALSELQSALASVGPSSDGGAADGAGRGSIGLAGAGPAGGPSGPAGRAPGVVDAEPSASPSPRGEPASGSEPAQPAPAPSADGPWWPPRYDAVVSRWNELRRSHP